MTKTQARARTKKARPATTLKKSARRRPKPAPLIDAHALVSMTRETPVPLEFSIAEILAASRQAHLEYREAVPRRVAGHPQTVVAEGDAAKARAALERARDLRQQAHDLDPAHVDHAWHAEASTHPHDELMAFYADQLRP